MHALPSLMVRHQYRPEARHVRVYECLDAVGNGIVGVEDVEHARTCWQLVAGGEVGEASHCQK